MKDAMDDLARDPRTKPVIKPRVKVVVRGLAKRRVVIEGFGRRAPVFLAVAGGDLPQGVWLSPRALRRLVEAAMKILK